ncbi:MAG: hypothetical protein U0Q22_19715 [Acidimicrobiales bacterium]
MPAAMPAALSARRCQRDENIHLSSLTPQGHLHVLRLVFEAGAALPATSGRNTVMRRYHREQFIEYLLRHIAEDVPGFETAAAGCDWSTE